MREDKSMATRHLKLVYKLWLLTFQKLTIYRSGSEINFRGVNKNVPLTTARS